MRTYILAGLLACGLKPATAQNFSQTYFFGDSNVDSGRYKYIPQRQSDMPPLVAGTGAYTTAGYPEWSQILGTQFGKTVTPSSVPGGGNNYAAGGAIIITTPSNPNDPKAQNIGGSGPGNSWSIVQQISSGYTSPTAGYGFQQSYLQGSGGQADPNALYTIDIGVNNLKTTPSLNSAVTQVRDLDAAGPITSGSNRAVDLQNLANVTVSQVKALSNAGARYFVVTDNYAGGGANVSLSRAYYDNAVYQGLNAAGINFIPADFRTIDTYIKANPTQFGITSFGIACQDSLGIEIVAAKCTTANLVPGAQSFFYGDGPTNGHRGQIVQKIQADYVYSLITAPSLISFLPENAVKTGLNRASTVQEQAMASISNAGQTGVNAWVTGDITSIRLDNYSNFPNDPNIVTSVQAGVDYKFARGVLAGVALSAGRLRSDLGSDGDFRQTETTVTVYGAYDGGLVWANVAGSLGSLDYKVNRTVPIGITYQQNTGKTSGDDWSVYGQAGLRFYSYGVTHGPVVGFVHQDIKVDGYTESGSALTNLQFNSQSRESTVGQFGYRVGLDYGQFHPFGQIMYNREFASTNRQVGASVLSLSQYGIFSPAYTMPAVRLGDDWGTATAGMKYDAGAGLTILGSFSGDFSQDNATVYGGRIGVNVAF